MKKGFTLVELIAVVILLLVIMAMVAPNMVKMSNERKQDVYNNKIKYLESSGVSWGDKHIDKLSKDKCTCVQLATLVNEGYAIGDDRARTTINDPRTNVSMNDKYVCVTYDHDIDRTYAKFLEDFEVDAKCETKY